MAKCFFGTSPSNCLGIPSLRSSHQRLLPARPAILPEELFSSWFVRLARANALKVQELLTLVTRSRRSFLGRDLDAVMDEDFARSLEAISGVPAERLKRMTFATHSIDLTAIDQPKSGPRRWILPKVSKRHRATQAWLQYCPECLLNDPTPYFRRHWRYAFVTTCPRHSIRLSSHCPSCEKVFDFEAYDIGQTQEDRVIPVSSCAHCRCDIRCGPVSRTSADRRTVRYERALCTALTRGCTRVKGTGWVYSHQVFDVLHRLLVQVRSSKELRRLFEDAFARQQKSQASMVVPPGKVESWPLDFRSTAITWLAELLAAWPRHFVDECSRFNVLRSAFKSRCERLPYWFDRIVTDHLYRPWYSPSQEEIASVRQAIRRAGQPDTQYNLRRWLGFYCQDKPFVRELAEPSPGQLKLLAGKELRKSTLEKRARELPSREAFEQLRPVLEMARVKKRRSRLDLYAIWCAVLYRERTRCSWAKLPTDFPKARTVRWYYVRWLLVDAAVAHFTGDGVLPPSSAP